LISGRNIPLFVIPGVPIMSRAFKDVRLFSGQGRNFVWLNWLVIVLLLGGTTLHFLDVYAEYKTYMQEHYPIDAIEYIKSSDLAEQDIYNTYGWGGYLIWNEIPVFIDGRADVYGDEFIEQFLTAYFVRPGWREALDAEMPDYLLVEARSSFAVLIDEVPAWQRAYADDVAVIFVRNATGE
jgi:hypothetical protein